MSRIVKIATICTGGPVQVKENRKNLDEIISHIDSVAEEALYDRPDIILFPEYSDIVYSECPENVFAFCKYRGNAIHEHIAGICKKNKVNICYGSFRDGKDGWYRNSAVFVGRNGETAGIYNKNHLVMEEFTDYRNKYGEDPVLTESDFGKVGAAICYDLQFDELREKYMKLGPELIVFPTSFPGGFLKQHWAFSNRCWFVSSYGSPRASSEVINPLGEVVAKSSYYFRHMTTEINLDYCIAHLDYNGERIKKMKAKYGEKVEVQAPGGLGRALITSYADDVSAVDMAKEFEIELIDDLFSRNLESRRNAVNSCLGL